MNGGSSSHPLGSRADNRPWIRCRPVKSMFRPPEYADLETIAQGWGVPVATAQWAIVIGELARYRRRAPELGEHGLAIAAAVRVLHQKRNRDSAGGAPRRGEVDQ